MFDVETRDKFAHESGWSPRSAKSMQFCDITKGPTSGRGSGGDQCERDLGVRDSACRPGARVRGAEPLPCRADLDANCGGESGGLGFPESLKDAALFVD